jgi:hypothetical protein
VRLVFVLGSLMLTVLGMSGPTTTTRSEPSLVRAGFRRKPELTLLRLLGAAPAGYLPTRRRGYRAFLHTAVGCLPGRGNAVADSQRQSVSASEEGGEGGGGGGAGQVAGDLVGVEDADGGGEVDVDAAEVGGQAAGNGDEVAGVGDVDPAPDAGWSAAFAVGRGGGRRRLAERGVIRG